MFPWHWRMFVQVMFGFHWIYDWEMAHLCVKNCSFWKSQQTTFKWLRTIKWHIMYADPRADHDVVLRLKIGFHCNLLWLAWGGLSSFNHERHLKPALGEWRILETLKAFKQFRKSWFEQNLEENTWIWWIAKEIFSENSELTRICWNILTFYNRQLLKT
jgi:hypothetical protein